MGIKFRQTLTVSIYFFPKLLSFHFFERLPRSFKYVFNGLNFPTILINKTEPVLCLIGNLFFFLFRWQGIKAITWPFQNCFNLYWLKYKLWRMTSNVHSQDKGIFCFKDTWPISNIRALNSLLNQGVHLKFRN